MNCGRYYVVECAQHELPLLCFARRLRLKLEEYCGFTLGPIVKQSNMNYQELYIIV